MSKELEWFYERDMDSEKQIIIETLDEEFFLVNGDPSSFVYAVGLYEWPDSLEPLKIDRKKIKRWCYFSDFIKKIVR